MSFEIEPILELVKSREKEFTEGMKEILDDGMPYGQKRPTDEEVVQFLGNMLEKYPFEYWVDEETGETIFASAWLEVLKNYNERTDKDKQLEGGESVYQRIEKAVQNIGGQT